MLLPTYLPDSRTRAGHLAAATLVSAAVAVVYGTIAWGMFLRFDDFQDHLDMARRFYETGRPPGPHFLFHGLTATLVATHLAPSFLVAGGAVTVAAYALTGLVTYATFWVFVRDSSLARPLLLGVVALVTVVAQPITNAQASALGYLWPEPYHSPTFALVKPFALMSFAGAAVYLSRAEAVGVRRVTGLALATIAGALSKPSFVICLIPAAALVTVYRTFRRLPVSIRGLVGGLFAPAAVVLAWQFVVTYAGFAVEGMYQDSVTWAPLKFMNYWATRLPTKLMASVAFPLVVGVLYWRQAWRDPLLQLAWLCFLFGALYTYAFVETINWVAGNFVWSGYITLFTLFAGTTVFWLRQMITPLPGGGLARALICGVVLACHVGSGVRLDWLYLTHYGCRVDLRLVVFVCN